MPKITGLPVAGSNPDIFSASTTQEMDLGAMMVTNDGSAYRYAKVGSTALVVGKLYDGPAMVADHSNVTVSAAAAIGATVVIPTLGATAATANQYAGGYMIVNDVTGEGYTYQIKSNPAADASATLSITLEDDSPIQVALTTSSQVTLVPNQYNGIVIHAASETGASVGVSLDVVAAASFCWIKTRGAVSVLQDASAGALGKSVGASTTTDGSVTANDGTLTEVGTMLQTGVSTEYNAVNLSID